MGDASNSHTYPLDGRVLGVELCPSGHGGDDELRVLVFFGQCEGRKSVRAGPWWVSVL